MSMPALQAPPQPKVPGPRPRRVPLTPMRHAAAKSMRKLAGHMAEAHPGTISHQHVRDAARMLESGNEEAAQRHLRAAVFSLTPQSMMRQGIHDDAAHIAAREALHGVHRHLLLVKDIADTAAKNQEAIRRDSYGDDTSSPLLPRSPLHADPNAGYGPGALAQKPQARQPGGDRALNAPARTNSGGSDPAVADPVGPQPKGSKQFARTWDEVARVVEMVGPKGYIHGWIKVGPGGGKDASSQERRPAIERHMMEQHGTPSWMTQAQDPFPMHEQIHGPESHVRHVMDKAGNIVHAPLPGWVADELRNRGSQQHARTWDQVAAVVDLAATMTKEQADYRPGGTPGHRCGDCTMIRGHSCTLVEGLIDPDHVCDHFEAAGGGRFAYGWDDLTAVIELNWAAWDAGHGSDASQKAHDTASATASATARRDIAARSAIRSYSAAASPTGSQGHTDQLHAIADEADQKFPSTRPGADIRAAADSFSKGDAEGANQHLEDARTKLRAAAETKGQQSGRFGQARAVQDSIALDNVLKTNKGQAQMMAQDQEDAARAAAKAAAKAAKKAAKAQNHAVTWDDLARVVELTGDGHGHHIPGSPDEWRHGYIPLTEAAAKSHGHGKVPKGWSAPGGSSKGKAAAEPETPKAAKPEDVTKQVHDEEAAKRAAAAESNAQGMQRMMAVGQAKRITAADREGLPGLVKTGSNPDGSFTAVDHEGTEHTVKLEGGAKRGTVTVSTAAGTRSMPAIDDPTRAARILAGNLAGTNPVYGNSRRGKPVMQGDKVNVPYKSSGSMMRSGTPGGTGVVYGRTGSASDPKLLVATGDARGYITASPGEVVHSSGGTAVQAAYGWNDLASVVELSARTAQLEVTPAPRGKPGGPGLYDVKSLEHTPYFQNVVKALIEKRGMPPGKAYAIAYGALRKWMRGGGHVHPEVQAAAAGALAGEKAKGAMAKAIHGHANWDDVARVVEMAAAATVPGQMAAAGQPVSNARSANATAQPRVGAGSPAGGQFAPAGSGGGGKKPDAHQQHVAHLQHLATHGTPAQQAAAKTALARLNGGSSKKTTSKATAKPTTTKTAATAAAKATASKSASTTAKATAHQSHLAHVAHLEHLASHGSPAQQKAAAAVLARLGVAAAKL